MSDLDRLRELALAKDRDACWELMREASRHQDLISAALAVAGLLADYAPEEEPLVAPDDAFQLLPRILVSQDFNIPEQSVYSENVNPPLPHGRLVLPVGRVYLPHSCRLGVTCELRNCAGSRGPGLTLVGYYSRDPWYQGDTPGFEHILNYTGLPQDVSFLGEGLWRFYIHVDSLDPGQTRRELSQWIRGLSPSPAIWLQLSLY